MEKQILDKAWGLAEYFLYQKMLKNSKAIAFYI